MILVRRLVLALMTYNILFSAEHIPGMLNILPDLLSRLQIKQPIWRPHPPTSSFEHLQNTAVNLIEAALTPNIKKVYCRALNDF